MNVCTKKLRTRLLSAGLGSVLSALVLTAGLTSVTTPAVAAVTAVVPGLNVARHGQAAAERSYRWPSGSGSNSKCGGLS